VIPTEQAGPYFHGMLAPADCANCPLRYCTKVFPDGPVPALMAIVAENPGRGEEREGRGLIGPTGHMIWQMCASFGLDRSQVWVSNASLCRSRDIMLTNGFKLDEAYIKALAAQACRGRLVNELRIVRPRVVVAIGNYALWALSDIPGAKVFDYRGSRLPLNLDALADSLHAGTARAPIRQLEGKVAKAARK